MSDVTLETWYATLLNAGHDAIMRDAEAVVKRAAVNVKRDWRKNATASAGRHARAYPYSITFDPVERHGGVIETLVGPDKGKRQGALGNLIEYGSAHNAPHWDGKRAAEAEAPRFAAYLLDVGVEALT